MTNPAGVTDEMIEAGARAINPGAYHRWDDGEYSADDIARTYARDEALKCLIAALAGHVVVPREPTPEMLEAAFNEPSGYWFHDVSQTVDDFNDEMGRSYRAMIAAAVDGEA